MRTLLVKALLSGICVFGSLPALALDIPDPTVRTLTGQQDYESWLVESVVIRNDSRFAMINGRIVREGDRIGSATVDEIRHGYVILKKSGRQIKAGIRDIKSGQ
ncbi:MAG: general secretion pathway protein GspB [Gammaproteobacteria bacterium]|nr:general secretion pathway protein GspB [Gammaproteobacteria bacterium]